MDPDVVFPSLEILVNEELHARVILQGVLRAERYVWIATANLKDMHVKVGRSFKPILDVFQEMANRGVSFRIIHCDLPSKKFRDTLERASVLTSGALELQICPRSHWKIAVVDGTRAYIGSANFTGAGLGPRSRGKRNMEIGIWTQERHLVQRIQSIFDEFWIGSHCIACSFRRSCPDPIRTSL